MVHGKDYDGRTDEGYAKSGDLSYAKSGDLLIRSDRQWKNSWATAVGSRFRRVAQEALQSQTNVDCYDPARHVVILGAGASFHAGLPKTEDITNLVLDELKGPSRRLDIHTKIQETIRPIPGDFEQFLGLLQTLAWSKRTYRQDLPEEDEWVNELLVSYKNVLLQAQFDINGKDITRQFLNRLEAESSGKWAIVSFNQDTSVECELKDMGVGWSEDNGFGAIVSEDVNAPLPDRRVYKPHGSIALHRPYAWPLRGIKFDDQAFERRSAESPNVKLAEEKYAPLIVIPSFLKIYVDDFLTNVVARVIFELLNARRILVVGFRLRPDDLIISTLIRYALGASAEIDSPTDRRSFTLVGPDARDFSNQALLGSA